MGQGQEIEHQVKVASSFVMCAAGFDPQTGAPEAYKFVCSKLSSLEPESDIVRVSAGLAIDLSENFGANSMNTRTFNKIRAALQENLFGVFKPN